MLNISHQQPEKLHVFGHQPTFDNMLSQGPPQKQRCEMKAFAPKNSRSTKLVLRHLVAWYELVDLVKM